MSMRSASKLAFAITQQPAEGTVTDNGDGTFSFDPGSGFQELAEGQTTTVTFKYTATDPGGATSNEATGTITVTGVNDVPVANSASAETTEDGPPVSVEAIADDVDSDDDPGTLDYKIVIQLPPGQGTVIEEGGGKFTFDPEDDFQDLSEGEIGKVAYAYTVTDSHGATSDIGIAIVTVVGVNDAPTAKGLEFETTEDGPVLLKSLASDDIDNDDDATTLTYILSPLSGKGTLDHNGKGAFSFDPGTDFDFLKAGESETVSFTYQTKDIHGAVSETATVAIKVTEVDDAPVANPVAVSATEDGGPVKELVRRDRCR